MRPRSIGHGWLVGNNILRIFAYAFIVMVFVIFVSVWTIRYTIERNCNDYYKRDINVFGYWLHIESGSTKKSCPNPYDNT